MGSDIRTMRRKWVGLEGEEIHYETNAVFVDGVGEGGRTPLTTAEVASECGLSERTVELALEVLVHVLSRDDQLDDWYRAAERYRKTRSGGSA